MRITLEIPNQNYHFFKELIGMLPFVKVVKNYFSPEKEMQKRGENIFIEEDTEIEDELLRMALENPQLRFSHPQLAYINDIADGIRSGLEDVKTDNYISLEEFFKELDKEIA